MKRFFSLLMMLTLLLSTAACGAQPMASNSSTPKSDESTVKPLSSPPVSPTATTPPASAPESAPKQESGKVLVVYYSATGTTQAVANGIAAVTGAELFELVPAEPYTDDDLNWRDEASRVAYEHDNPEARNIALEASTVSDWESYDTVFIGYPVWWGIAAWPVDGFVKGNDFTGKTVIPFCTSSSSGLGESGELLAAMAGTGNWQSGQRFSGGTSDSAVQEWISGLGL